MSNGPEEFEQLRKLLKLKRYEQPPPRFFQDFPLRVLDAIEEGRSRNAKNQLWIQTPWLARLFGAMERNALVAGSFVTGICALPSRSGSVAASSP